MTAVASQKHQPHGCLLNWLFKRRSKKLSRGVDIAVGLFSDVDIAVGLLSNCEIKKICLNQIIKAPCHWPFVGGIHRWPMNSLHKGPVTRKMVPFDDVSMNRSLSDHNKLQQNVGSVDKSCKISRINYLTHTHRGLLTGTPKLRRDSWWRHQMETFSALLAFCAGN